MSRTVALAVGAWLLVVTGGAVLTWTVISDAGQGVAGPRAPVETGTGPTSELPSDQATGGPSDRPTKSPTGRPSDDPTGSPTSPPTSPTTGPTTQAPPPPATTPADEPQTVRRTWRGAGGVVIAECTGSTIRLVGAQPASGWKVEVDDTGPDRVRVEFDSDDDDVRVEAVCSGGAPRFSVN